MSEPAAGAGRTWWARDLVSLEGRWEFLARPGAWFWIAIGIGAALRFLLAITTRGTTDAEIWTQHAMRVATQGLMQHYREDPIFNHPPFISLVMAWLWRLAQSIGVEFRIVYRVPFSLFDLANIALLARVLRRERWRYAAAAGYAVAPVAIILGGMHGNTDALIATSLLLACLGVGAGRPAWAGLALGVGAWIKLPGLLAAPAIGWAFPRWRDRVLCALVTIGVAGATYIGAVTQDPGLLGQRVFGYSGLFIHTLDTPPIWIWGFKNWLIRLFDQPSEDWPAALLWYLEHSQYLAIGLMLAFAYLRRRDNDARGVAITIAASYAIFYGLVETWTFQYFAWSMPFWFVAGWPFALAANLFGGGYLYALYAHVCGDWLLRPVWAFSTAKPWPSHIIVLRDLAHLTFFCFGMYWLLRTGARTLGAGKGQSAPTESEGSR